ncbi:MAG: hypothetical protein GX591_13535, partial [Planctomycetes bacterium]|nr:hypothetical protein [Planctomycetota bacterium]
ADACNWLLDVDRNGRVDPDTDGVTLYRALKYGHILDDMDCTVVPILPPDYAAFAASYLPCDSDIVGYVEEMLGTFDLNVDDSASGDGDNIPAAIGYAKAVSASRDGVYVYRNLSYYYNDIYPRYDTTLPYSPFVNPSTAAGSTDTVPAGHAANADAVNAQIDLLKIYGCVSVFGGKGPVVLPLPGGLVLPCWWQVVLPAGTKVLPLPQAPWACP